jgi:glycosyltransferase involved in cell wall biosynthesis
MLFFGFIRKYKGLSYLLDAMPEILKEFPVTLLIVGDFWDDKQKHIRQITELNLKSHVKIFDSYISNDEIAKYFSASDVVIAPYVTGSNSGVINLSYAFNKPVIATNVGEFSKLVIDGSTGYLVKPQNSQQIASAIIKFYKNSHGRKFKTGIKKLKKDLSWENLCKSIICHINKTQQ